MFYGGAAYILFGNHKILQPTKPVIKYTKQERAITTQQKKVAAPTNPEKQPAIDEKKLLKTDIYFGNFTNPKIKKEAGTIDLKVWHPYIDYMQTLPALIRDALLKPPYGYTVEYDEIWIQNNYSDDDITTLYWKDNKIQAYTLKQYYEGNPLTHASVNAHQITSIYGRNFILTEIPKKK